MTEQERIEEIAELRTRLAEYEAATADMDFETGAGYFRWDAARDELIGVLLGEEDTGVSPGLIPWLLDQLDTPAAPTAASSEEETNG